MASSESSPLLGGRRGSTEDAATTSSRPRSDVGMRARARDIRQHFDTWAPMYFCCLMSLTIDLPGFVGESVRIRMYEDSICRDHYRHADSQVIFPDGDIPEAMCKIPPIQSRLAEFVGLQGLLNELISLILVVPYGIAADIYGRKTIIIICMVGMTLANLWTALVMILYNTFPVNAALFSTAFLLIGGGNPVIIPIVLAMISDYMPAELR
jgi:hypothetical protein